MCKSFAFLIALAIWLTACTRVPGYLPEQPTDTCTSQVNAGTISTPTPFFTILSATSTQTVTSTAQPTIPSPSPTQTLSPSPTPVPILSPITPDVVSVCPQVPEVPLEKFGLGDFYLIVRPYDPQSGKMDPQVVGAVVVPLGQPTARVISGSNDREEWELIEYKLATDGQFLELVYAEKDGDRRQVWHSSWDGQQQWMVSEFHLPPLPPGERDPFYYYRQIDENWYAAMKSDVENTSYPIMIYNHSTGETREIPPFPNSTFVRDFFWMDGSLHMTYFQGQDLDVVMLYNLDTFTAVPIFQWLAGKRWTDSLYTHWFYRNESFNIQVMRSYGVDLGIELDLDTILSSKAYEEVMQAFYLPGSENSFLSGGFLDSPKGYFYERYNPDHDNSSVYLLGFDDLVIREYCYTVESFSSSHLWTFHSTSPDNRFVAYTHIELGIGGKPDRINRVEILDLATGEYATIPDANYEVIGWGRK